MEVTGMSLDQMVIFKDKYWKNYGNNMGIPDSNELKLEDTLNKGNNRLCDGISCHHFLQIIKIHRPFFHSYVGYVRLPEANIHHLHHRGLGI